MADFSSEVSLLLFLEWRFSYLRRFGGVKGFFHSRRYDWFARSYSLLNSYYLRESVRRNLYALYLGFGVRELFSLTTELQSVYLE